MAGAEFELRFGAVIISGRSILLYFPMSCGRNHIAALRG
jgi:hypothetical protein